MRILLWRRSSDLCVYFYSWWKVKVKGESQEEGSPAGLVPAAYVEPVSIYMLPIAGEGP